MGWAREESQPTAPNWNDRLVCIVRGVATARAGESAGRAMVEEFGSIFGSEAAERTELFEVVVTPDERDRELIEKQERNAFSSR